MDQQPPDIPSDESLRLQAEADLREATKDARARMERAEELAVWVRLLQEAYPPGPWTPRYPALRNA